MITGGTVKSSFKPGDNAKLHASPQNIQTVALMSPTEDNSSNSNGQNILVEKSSPTRAKSMPPRPIRPQVLQHGPAEIPRSSPPEAYNYKNVSYTTHTTFRSPITPDDPTEDRLQQSVRNVFYPIFLNIFDLLISLDA